MDVCCFWTGTMLLTGCHTAVDQSGQEKTEPIAPTFTITTKPQIYVTDLQNGRMMSEASTEFLIPEWCVTMLIFM